jgi:uncharacterized protein
VSARWAVAGLIALALAAPGAARAQCPSNASSCAICHEGGEQPPSQDGSPWHTAHAYADLCVGCHGGDREAMDEGAHRGLRSPLADPAASCGGCHDDGPSRAAAWLPLLTSQTDDPAPPPIAAPVMAEGASRADQALLVLALALGGWIVLLVTRTSPAALLAALRAPGWPPALAGLGLGLVVTASQALCGRPIAVSGGIDRLAAYVGARLLPESSYYRFVVPPAITWQVWLLVGLVAGAAASAAASGTLRARWLPDEGWTETHGPSRSRRLALAFIGAVLVQIGAGIAGGCTSGLAISGGALLAPGAFVFVAGMFGGGIPTAWAWARRSP